MILIKQSLHRDKKGPLFWFECPECQCGQLRQKYKGLNRSRCGQCRYSNHVNIKHGLSQTPEYKSWSMMRARCLNPNYDGYPNYGGKGVTICSRWVNSFERFLEDMGSRPDGTSLDRIDPYGNYEPGNCRWASASVQSSNRRAHGKTGFRGVEKNGPGWCARIRSKGYRRYLGQFNTPEEAESAYLNAAKVIYDN
jgi:hypothetical protein